MRIQIRWLSWFFGLALAVGLVEASAAQTPPRRPIDPDLQKRPPLPGELAKRPPGAVTTKPLPAPTAPPTATSGRYRIVIPGVRAEAETFDDVFERDGKRDEIYVAAAVQHYDRRDRRLLAQGVARTSIMGDVNGFPARIQAGSASPRGGIRTGDNVPAVPDVATFAGPGPSGAFPLVVWEGELQDAADVLVIQPDVWEWDGDGSLYTAWSGTTGWSTIDDPSVQAQIADQTLGPVTTLGGTEVRWLSVFRAGMDRPLGLARFPGAAAWRIAAVVVTREAVERAFREAGSVGGRLPTTVEISRTGDDGNYRLFLRVERMP
jgi:hypothetical protein